MIGMLRMQRAVVLVFLSFAILALNPALARMYRWIDASGQVHYSDRLPPEYADRERKVYDEEGRLISTVHATKTKEPLAVEKEEGAHELQRHRKAQHQDTADKALLKSHANTQGPKKTTEKPLAAIE